MASSDLAALARTELMSKRGPSIRTAIRTAAEHRRRIKEGDFSVFLIPLTFAIAKDGLLDLLAHIPFFGFVIVLAFSFPISVYLFIFLWGRGKWKVRIVAFFLSFFEFIPLISMIPWQTVMVAYAYYLAKKDASESVVALESAEKGQKFVQRRIERVVGRPAEMNAGPVTT